MGFAVFFKEPKSIDIRRFLGRAIGRHGQVPRYIISDKGPQFDCHGFRAWCRRRGIRPRYASTGSLRATAIIERFFRSLKEEYLRRIQIPLRREAMRRELNLYASWFFEHRPHQGLGGRTPKDTYEGLPEQDVATRRRDTGQKVPESLLVVRFYEGRKELPIVELEPAA